jgi:hypothetical protein
LQFSPISLTVSGFDLKIVSFDRLGFPPCGFYSFGALVAGASSRSRDKATKTAAGSPSHIMIRVLSDWHGCGSDKTY